MGENVFVSVTMDAMKTVFEVGVIINPRGSDALLVDAQDSSEECRDEIDHEIIIIHNRYRAPFVEGCAGVGNPKADEVANR